MTTTTTTTYWLDSTVTPTPGYYELTWVEEGGVMCFEGVEEQTRCNRVELNYESFALYSVDKNIRPLDNKVNLEALLAMHNAAEDLTEGEACQLVRALGGVTSSMECPYYLIGEWVEYHTATAVDTAYAVAVELPRYQEIAVYLAPLPC